MSDRKPTFQVFALRQPFVAFESRLWRPAHNMYETESGVVLVVDLAGVEPADLHVHVHPRHVAVHGVRQLAAPHGLRRVQQMEIGAGPFQLEVPLERVIDPEQARGHYTGGLLTIELPFAQQEPTRVVVIRVEGGRQ
jgi:HSP20 family protein